MPAKKPPKRDLTTTARDLAEAGISRLKSLGSGPRPAAARTLETFPNPGRERDYAIRLEIPEFTCLCPKTGQPDFATLHLEYVPDAKCVELKSLKLYIWSFRNEGKFHEAVTNEILDDLVAAVRPRYMRLTAEFLVRGGIYTSVEADYRMKGWKAPERVDLGPAPGDDR
jgi:7-cyano-7-deazaguanine reductase